jgi:nicotinate-nucleotide adenylyltransferase
VHFPFAHFTFRLELRNKISLRKKIGIFGGTFDPIHHGHLILARDAIEQLELDELIFIPAALSPHKPGGSPADADVRVEMLRAAIEGEPRFCLDTLELKRPAPSYSVETIETLRSREPDAQFIYLIGEDNVAQLSTWRRFPDLSEMVQFAVLDRTGLSTAHPYPTVRRHVDISASDIRNRVAHGQSIRYFVPPAVEKIIRARQLYLESSKSPPKI